MTQLAKAQEPSMEEILASIRRIIADDEAKPAEKPASTAAPAGSASPGAAPPAAKPSVMADIPPSAIAAAQATPAKAPEPPGASSCSAGTRAPTACARKGCAGRAADSRTSGEQ